MKIEGLKPTHYEKDDRMVSYAKHLGEWYFVAPFSFDGKDYDWIESMSAKESNEFEARMIPLD